MNGPQPTQLLELNTDESVDMWNHVTSGFKKLLLLLFCKFLMHIMLSCRPLSKLSSGRIRGAVEYERQCYWKACLKQNVINLDLKVCAEGVIRTLRGKQFQMDRATCLKAREPIFSLCESTSNRWVYDDERSEWCGIAMTILDERYEGSPDWRILYVSIATLKLIFHLIGSQCRLWSIAEMLDWPCWWVTTRASVFWNSF